MIADSRIRPYTNPTILYLYSEVMGYTLTPIRYLIRNHGCTVYLVYWDTKKLTPYQIPAIEGLHTRPRSSFKSSEELTEWTKVLQPDLVYVSGRMDELYLKAALAFRKKKVPLVSGMDNQWQGTWRQRIAVCFSYFFYRRYFDYLWVAGPLQYLYAVKLGYTPDKILQQMYSADTELFTGRMKKNNLSADRVLLFVGRLDRVKGIEQAVKIFLKVREKSKYNWQLKLIGSGPLDGKLAQSPYVQYIPFLSPSELALQVENASAFLLPSINEPWGVVVHEMAAAGMPLFTSDKVGANAAFLIPGYNGYIFEAGNTNDFKTKLLHMLNLPDETLTLMGERSMKLAQKITPEYAAASLFSVLQ